MLNIKEYGYNACERNGTLESCKLFEHRLELLKKRNVFNRNEQYQWIYLGFEFCENMMQICEITQVKEKIAMAEAKGYQVAFVLPPMHQKSVPVFKEWIRHLVAQNLVSEWVVNDLGTFSLLEEAKARGSFVLGRLFEKAIREARQNILEIPEVERHFEILQPGSNIESICDLLGKRYHICGAEVDTFPNGILHLPENEIGYRVHYPDIFLSCSSYCEYANMDHEEKERFLLHSSCYAECCLYEQKLIAPNERTLYKVGNVMLCRQENEPEACIEGNCRIVYSDRVHEYH